jgi:hypothetical protein
MTKCVKYILLICCLWQIGLHAQDEDEQGKYPPDYDTNYIMDFRHRLNLSLVTEAKANIIALVAPNDKLLLYSTNLPVPNYGVMVSYRWLNFSFSVPIPGLSYVPEENGETSSLSLALGLTGRKWYLRNFFERFKGYYLSNPQDLFPDWPAGSDNLVFPNMQSTTYYATAYYGFNGEKYSHRSLLWQSEIQRKSAGSLLVGATGGFKQIRSPDDIFQGTDANDVNAARYIMFGLNIGYAYTLVIKHNLNISLAVIPGGNYTRGTYSNDQNEEQTFRNDFGINAEGRFQILYEHENFYTGLAYTLYLLTDFIDDQYPVGSAHNYLKLNIGWRFKMKPVKILKPFGLSN